MTAILQHYFIPFSQQKLKFYVLNFSPFHFLSNKSLNLMTARFFIYLFYPTIVSQSSLECQYPLYRSQKHFKGLICLQGVNVKLVQFKCLKRLLRTFQGYLRYIVPCHFVLTVLLCYVYISLKWAYLPLQCLQGRVVRGIRLQSP